MRKCDCCGDTVETRQDLELLKVGLLVVCTDCVEYAREIGSKDDHAKA